MVAGEVLFLSLFFFLFLLFTKREMDSVKLGKMATVRASIRMDERGGGGKGRSQKARERKFVRYLYITIIPPLEKVHRDCVAEQDL